jgi:hypothetical protein
MIRRVLMRSCIRRALCVSPPELFTRFLLSDPPHDPPFRKAAPPSVSLPIPTPLLRNPPYNYLQLPVTVKGHIATLHVATIFHSYLFLFFQTVSRVMPPFSFLLCFVRFFKFLFFHFFRAFCGRLVGSPCLPLSLCKKSCVWIVPGSQNISQLGRVQSV